MSNRLFFSSIALAAMLAGCDSDLPPLVTNSAEAGAIAVEQCGNEFSLGQPSKVDSAGDAWSVSWPNGFASVDDETGTVLSCGLLGPSR